MNQEKVKLSAGRPTARTGKTYNINDLDQGRTKRISCQITPENHAKLKIYAAKQNKTISQVITEYVDQLPE